MACVNQKKNNTESGGASSASNFFVKKWKENDDKKEFGLFQLIWLRLNIQFVEKLSLKVIGRLMIFTQKCIKMYALQAYMHIDGLYNVYAKKWHQKCGIYQTTNIFKKV